MTRPAINAISKVADCVRISIGLVFQTYLRSSSNHRNSKHFDNVESSALHKAYNNCFAKQNPILFNLSGLPADLNRIHELLDCLDTEFSLIWAVCAICVWRTPSFQSPFKLSYFFIPFGFSCYSFSLFVQQEFCMDCAFLLASNDFLVC